MKTLKRLLLGITGVVLLYAALNLINVLQNGLGGPDGRSADAILGVPAARATKQDVEKLSKSEVMQLFHGLDSPGIKDLKGEYRAENLDLGVMAFSVALYTDHFFGPGRWQGKGLRPGRKGNGIGYNLFASRDEKGGPVLRRTRRLETHVGPSNIDGKRSFHLVYRRFNGGLVHSMHDELRRVNGALFLGMGYMALGGGSINPSPFVVFGPPSPWRGPDPE